MGSWIQTYTGCFDYKLYGPDSFSLVDIAHALSLQCRYGGHIVTHYSVAQHCTLLARGVELAGGDVELQACALMHDAAEAYVNDIPYPLKNMVTDYGVIENEILKAIFQNYGLPWPMPKLVKELDRHIVANETPVLFLHQPWWLSDAGLSPISGLEVIPWTADIAERVFTYAAAILGIKD